MGFEQQVQTPVVDSVDCVLPMTSHGSTLFFLYNHFDIDLPTLP
jgi:hypothetical protein